MMSGNLLSESKVPNPAGKPKDEVDAYRPVFRAVFLFFLSLKANIKKSGGSKI